MTSAKCNDLLDRSKIIVFISSVSASKEIKQKQSRILQVLEARRIPHEKVDIATDEAGKREMRMLTRNSKAVPPQIFNKDRYCGDYDAFYLAVEDEIVEEWLGIRSKPKPGPPPSDASTLLAAAGSAVAAAAAKKSSVTSSFPSSKAAVDDTTVVPPVSDSTDDTKTSDSVAQTTDTSAPAPPPPPPPAPPALPATPAQRPTDLPNIPPAAPPLPLS